MTGQVEIRVYQPADASRLAGLFQAVAAVPGGVARTPHEVSVEWADSVIRLAFSRGVGLFLVKQGEVVAAIHGWRPEPAAFSHLIGDITMGVHPANQGEGLGRLAMETFIDSCKDLQPPVCRLELAVRESNSRARKLYESLGFITEGVLQSRIRSASGDLESDYLMAKIW